MSSNTAPADVELPSLARQRLAILAAALPALLLSAKLLHVLFEPLAGGNRQWVVDAVLLMVMEFIMVVVIATTVVEPFPAFGFTPEVLQEIRPAFGKSKGVWVDEPHRAVAAGAVYFLLNGLFELARLTRVKKPSLFQM